MKEKTFISKNIRRMSMEGTTLSVQFNNGRVYEYYDVPEDMWLEIAMALSIGDLFNRKIKNKFEFKEVKNEQ